MLWIIRCLDLTRNDVPLSLAIILCSKVGYTWKSLPH